LNIDFMHVIEFPCIAGIIVQGPGITRKVNCGGPAYKDYQADLSAVGPDTRPRDLPADDFYLDWATAQFGPKAAEPIAKFFTRLDGGPSATAEGQRNTNLPRPSTWVRGPGGIKPDPRPWEQVSKEYEFVDQFCLLRPLVRGRGNLERFYYWLNNFRYMRAVGKVNCTWARFNAAMKKVKDTKEPDAQKRLARQTALPLRQQLVGQVAEVHRHLLLTVNTPGAMGNVTNWQQHLIPTLLTQPGDELAGILGEQLPSDAMPSKQYVGIPRLIMPTVRSSLMAGEDLRIKVIILHEDKPRDAALYWRPMGSGYFNKIGLSHVARGVYSAKISTGQIRQRDLEYYIKVNPAKTPELTFPTGAPQTVVIMGR
jgi:hypothetical protein